MAILLSHHTYVIQPRRYKCMFRYLPIFIPNFENLRRKEMYATTLILERDFGYEFDRTDLDFIDIVKDALLECGLMLVHTAQSAVSCFKIDVTEDLVLIPIEINNEVDSCSNDNTMYLKDGDLYTAFL
jgi:hypothetical protein